MHATRHLCRPLVARDDLSRQLLALLSTDPLSGDEDSVRAPRGLSTARAPRGLQ